MFVDYKDIPPSEDDKKHESLSDNDRRKFGIKQAGLITTVKIIYYEAKVSNFTPSLQE